MLPAIGWISRVKDVLVVSAGTSCGWKGADGSKIKTDIFFIGSEISKFSWFITYEKISNLKAETSVKIKMVN